VNSDTGTNYSLVRMAGNGSSTFSSTASTNYLPLAFSGNPQDVLSTLQIMDYSATDKHKTVLSRGNGVTATVSAIAARWADTSAITSVEVGTQSTTTLDSGSTVSLYGIAK